MRQNHPCIAFRKLYFRHASKRDVNVQQCATAVVTQLKIMPCSNNYKDEPVLEQTIVADFTTFRNLHEETARNHIGQDSNWVLLE